MQTCMHMYHTWTITVCTRPGLSSCWSQFWKILSGSVPRFYGMMQFHLLRAFLGFADTTSCNMMWVGCNIFLLRIPWIGWILMSKRWNNVNIHIKYFQSTADVANNTVLFSKLLSPTSCNMMWVGGYKFWDEHNDATLSQTKRSWSFNWFQNDVSRRKIDNKVGVSFESCLSCRISI